MKRLTHKQGDRWSYVSGVGKYDINSIQACIDKLAAYEDTGLTPEEIIQLKQAYNNAVKLALDTDDELTAVEKERDAAVRDLMRLNEKKAPCSICAFEDALRCCHADHCNNDYNHFKWRGVQETEVTAE